MDNNPFLEVQNLKIYFTKDTGLVSKKTHFIKAVDDV
jgi:ABC-type oligopeptide transport system ATPase subunit